MEVKIKYSELQDFILHNFKKEVSLAFVAPSTVSLSTKIKFLGFAKSIGGAPDKPCGGLCRC